MSAVFDPEISALKLPPHSVEAEQSVLGGLMLENSAWERVADLINEQDFYRSDHRAIWKQIVRLVDENKPADVVTVAEALESLEQLDHAGGLAYLAALAQNTPSAANIRRYAEIVRERSVLRKLVEVGAQISDSALAPAGRSAAQILDEAEARVFEIKEAGAKTTQGFLPVQPLLIEVVNRFGSFFYGSILGVFLLAVLWKRASGHAAFLALLIGMGTVAYVASATKVAFLWLNVVGATTVFATGIVLSVVLPRRADAQTA